MKRSYIASAFLFFMISIPLLCGNGEEREQLKAFVSILPQSYLVERIGGESVTVQVFVEPGKDPHTFEPTPKQMMFLGKADLYFAIGFPFEEQILKKVESSNPGLLIIRTDSGVKRRRLDEHLHENERQDRDIGKAQDPYGGGEPDPHIWLGPEQIKIQAKNVYDGFVKRVPENRQKYKENLDLFLKELATVHERLAGIFAPYRGRAFFVYHPAFGYFADAYGLVQLAVEIEAKSPTPKQIERLIEEAKEQSINIVFVSPQFDRTSAQTIADAIGGVVVPIDPFEKDVMKSLEDVARKIASSFK